MALANLVTRPCLITRRSENETANSYGDKHHSESDVEALCELQQRGRGEDDQDLSTTGWLLILLPGTEIHAGDTVTVDGKVFEVDGEPWVADTGSPAVHHIEASLQRVAGADDEAAS